MTEILTSVMPRYTLLLISSRHYEIKFIFNNVTSKVQIKSKRVKRALARNNLSGLSTEQNHNHTVQQFAKAENLMENAMQIIASLCITSNLHALRFS